MARLTSHARLNFGMVISPVLVEFVQFATVNICNNDVKELTHLKALRLVWPVNWSRSFSHHPKEKRKKRSGHTRLLPIYHNRCIIDHIPLGYMIYGCIYALDSTSCIGISQPKNMHISLNVKPSRLT